MEGGREGGREGGGGGRDGGREGGTDEGRGGREAYIRQPHRRVQIYNSPPPPPIKGITQKHCFITSHHDKASSPIVRREWGSEVRS